MAVTTKDIAKLAGVSQSTVSRSLNRSPLISKKTQERVLRIAKEQNFEFNANARSLSTNISNSIGLIFPDDYMEFGLNLYFGALHTHIRETVEKLNYDLIIGFEKNKYTDTNTIRRLVAQKKVDGLIIALPRINSESMEFLSKAKIPFIFLHFHQVQDCLSNTNQIYADHLHGGYIATKHLIDLGHRKIVCLSSKDGQEFEERRNGYIKALIESGIAVNENLFLFGDRSFKSGFSSINENLKLFKKATALFCHTDIMALGALEAFKLSNIRVPEEIAVIGYDDIELGNYFSPLLTTVHQPREEISSLAIERLVQLIESNPRRNHKEIVVKPSLVIRESCGTKLSLPK